MKRRPIKTLLAIVALAGFAACSTSTIPKATPPAASSSENSALMQRLWKAEAYDRDNSEAFTRSAPGLDHYYSRKADEVSDVIRQLQQGREVPQDDIDHALDNSLASTFGVPMP